MKNALEKQEKQLAELTDLTKQDRLLQLSAQNHHQKVEKADEQLNSNVIQLFKEVKKQTKAIEKMSPERAGQITDKSMALEQFKTIGERIGDFKKGFKDFFTLKGFLNKTGIVDAESGGIVSTAVNRRAARMQYVEDRMKTDPNYYKIAKGATDEEKKATARRTFGAQFDEQQRLRRDMRANEGEISRLEKAGYREDQIKKAGLFQMRGTLAEQMEKVDPRIRQVKEQESKSSVRTAKVTEDGGAKTVSADSFSDEAALESQRQQAQVIDLLSKIEANTRGAGGGEEEQKEEPKKKVGGFLDGILEKALGWLKEGVMAALKFLFNPKNLLKIFTKVFIPAMIVGAIVNGIIDAFNTFFDGGDFIDVLLDGLGGIIEFLSFGLIDAETLKSAVTWMGKAVDEYIITPVTEFFSWMGDLFDIYIVEPLTNIATQLYGLLDEYVLKPLAKVFEPVKQFFIKMKNDVISFLEDFGIPEISFTIPIIKKKVSIGPFYPFRPEPDVTKISSETQLKTTQDSEGNTRSSMQQNIVSTDAESTRVLVNTERQDNNKVDIQDAFAQFDPKTGKAILGGSVAGEEGVKDISARAFRQIKSAAREGKDTAAIAEIVKEDEAYQQLGFWDKRKVDVGYAKATDLLAASKPQVTSGTEIYNRSAANAQASMTTAQPAPVIVNAPTNVNTTNRQNITMPAPVRNNDGGFIDYISNTSYIGP
jgi:hypothetical protein